MSCHEAGHLALLGRLVQEAVRRGENLAVASHLSRQTPQNEEVCDTQREYEEHA